jgi:hypothetical protein
VTHDVLAALDKANALETVLKSHSQVSPRSDVEHAGRLMMRGKVRLACCENHSTAAGENGVGLGWRGVKMERGVCGGRQGSNFPLPNLLPIPFYERVRHEQPDLCRSFPRREIDQRAKDVDVLHQIQQENDAAPFADTWCLAH